MYSITSNITTKKYIRNRTLSFVGVDINIFYFIVIAPGVNDYNQNKCNPNLTCVNNLLN